MAQTNSCVPTSLEVTMQFKEILESNGITDPVSEIIVSDTELKAENWGGTTNNITIKFENLSKKPLHLFVKKKIVRESALDDVFQAYERETVFLMEYLPLARTYCKGLGHEDLLNIYPKCYYADEKMIVLENLSLEENFVMLKKEERQDFDTAKLALINLAKHHAISHAMIQDLRGPELFFERFGILKYEAFRKEPILVGLCSNLDNGIDIMVKILEGSRIEGSKNTIDKLKSKRGKLFNEVSHSFATNHGKSFLLNHGDYWNNNMMFRKDKENEPDKMTDHVLLDFGAVRYASPCLDVAFYFFTSAKPIFFWERFQELLELYWYTLKTVSNELGYSIQLSLDDLHADFCSHFYYAFWIGLGFITQAVHKAHETLESEIKESKDRGNVLENLHKLIEKCIEENPEECKNDAENIIDYVKLYDRFNNGEVGQWVY